MKVPTSSIVPATHEVDAFAFAIVQVRVPTPLHPVALPQLATLLAFKEVERLAKQLIRIIRLQLPLGALVPHFTSQVDFGGR